jgi:hypothetical protein
MSSQRRAGEPVYNSMPTPSFVRPTQTAPVVGPVTAAPSATEIVTRPPPHTLAAGRYEAKSYEIWLLVLGGAILVLLFALVRVRLALKKKHRATEALTAVLRRPAGHTSR